MRTLLVVVLAVAASSCAGFRALDRGEWRLVYVDSARRDAEAPREVVTRDAYEEEVAAGTRRGWEAPAGYSYPALHELERLELKVGEVAALRVDESTEADVLVDGNTVQAWWGPVEKKDTWQGDIDVTVRESMLYLKGLRAGPAAVRLVRGPQTKDVPVTVK